mgnify:CR=1 FL=1
MKQILIAGKIALTAIVLWLVLSHIDLDETRRNVTAFSFAGLFGVACILGIQQLIASQRLSLVMALLGQRLGFAAAVHVTLVGFFFGQTFLSFLGGDAARLWELNKRAIGLQSASSGVLLDRLSGLIANHILILLMLPGTLQIVTEPVARLAVIAVAIAGLLGIVMLFALALLRGRLGLERRITARLGEQRWITILFDLVSVLKAFFAAPGQAASVLALGVLVNLFNAMMIYVLFRDLDAGIGLTQCVALVPLIMELALVPISIAGWGVREGLMVAGFGMAGVTASAAFSVSVLFGLIAVVFGMVGGVMWLLHRPVDRRLTPDMEE